MERVNRILRHPDFIRLQEELDRLEADRRFCRHGMQHLIDTARLAYLFALESSADLPKDVIYAAALLHDIGRAEQYRNGTPHDVAGCAAAEPILAECGFAEEERDMILTAIGSHRKEKSRVSGGAGQEKQNRSRKDPAHKRKRWRKKPWRRFFTMRTRKVGSAFFATRKRSVTGQKRRKT